MKGYTSPFKIDIFTAASRLLFRATEERVYFGQINIVVPISWSQQGEAQPVKQSERGHFKVGTYV
ncbi:hypothetical protein MAR_013551 [Mya arenaria]|uniref:Calcium-activated chloride channel N-terminal domain-containing protein n=1 Tax=Mya arenaria TaxID=6604 RepID=A0ABY7G085_MYAAR|nr:hypothetical protein MAR_013551 [Mya arenaria]